jgi:hypothetical protein
LLKNGLQVRIVVVQKAESVKGVGQYAEKSMKQSMPGTEGANTTQRAIK